MIISSYLHKDDKATLIDGTADELSKKEFMSQIYDYVDWRLGNPSPC